MEDIGVPVCAKFDTQKVMELLNLCIRRNSFGIDQYDVVYLHLLLNSELNCIVNTEIGVIRQVRPKLFLKAKSFFFKFFLIPT